MKRLPLLFALVWLWLFHAGTDPLSANDSPRLDESRWLPRVEAFEEQDRQIPPPPGSILFVGSSSIERWNLAESLPDWTTLNRGIGGCDLSTVIHYSQRILVPYQPRAVVVYAGDNDLARGKSVETVVDDFSALANLLHERLPDTPLIFLAIKPSLARWHLIDSICEANSRIAALCQDEPMLFFVDVASPMLNTEGTPQPELFVEDGLHLSSQGYALWSDTLVPILSEAVQLSESRQPPQGPLSIEEALLEFRIHPELVIEPVAWEPDVVDPVCLRFDPRGRMWVVEYRDYPNGPPEGSPGTCRIRILADDGQTGRYRHVQTFADHLLFCNSLMFWQDGVLVTSDGKLLFLRDTTGDGVADERTVWFEGFTTENPQLRANHPLLGLDNHVYVANGLRGGEVIGVRQSWPHAGPVSLSGRDFRFHPFTGEYEAVSGLGQFGHCFDDWGNRFECSNRNPCIHVVLEGRHLARNPHVLVPSVLHDVSPAGELSRVFPISRSWTTSTLHAGQFTAACGVTIYRGNGLPADWYGDSFTCEPTGNLVHHDRITPDGATFTSRPDREGVECLASRDEWFRPVNLTVGPDGALYVVDMYRAVIEHPQYMPDELQTRPDLTLGNNRGRIWRIRARETTLHREPLDLDLLAPSQLAELLEHPNVWQRETAHRLLLQRQSDDVVPHLARLAHSGLTPQSRAHALWLLHGLGQITEELLWQALFDASPRVIEQALKIIEADRSANERISRRVAELVADTDDERLRFQCLLTPLSAPLDASLLADQFLRAGGDPWVRRALGLSVVPETGTAEVLRTALELAEKPGSVLGEAVGDLTPWKDLAEWTGRSGDLQASAMILTLPFANERPGEEVASSREIRRMAIAAALLRGHKSRGQSLQTLLQPLEEASRQTVWRWLEYARAVALHDHVDLGHRLEALALLEFDPSESTGETLRRLAIDTTHQELAAAALNVLARNAGIQDVAWLTDDFMRQTPALRRARLSALFSQESRLLLLLDALEQGTIPLAELDPVRQNQLRQHSQESIRTRAAPLLAAAIPEDRRQVIEEYQACLTLQADPVRGRLIFARQCAICHQVGGIGVNVAPDIGDTRVKTPAQLLTDILDPNRAVDNNYFAYSVVDTEGRIHTGIITSETPTSITLRQPEGKTLIFSRDEIDDLQSTGLSLMPVALERNIPPQDMADLISFLKNWRYLDGQVPPEVIR